MSAPKISVIMSVYNHERFVAQAVESILNQTCQDFELIIADDCSTDRSREIVDSYKDERISRYYRNDNIGPCAILNYMISLAKGEYIAIMNSDDVWSPEKLEKQVAYMDANPDCGVCLTWAKAIDGKGEDLPESAAEQSVNTSGNYTSAEWFRRLTNGPNELCHPSALLRSSMCSQIGGYNPVLCQIGDIDFWLRAVQVCRIHVIPERLVDFRWYRLDDVENISSATPEKMGRLGNEITYILEKEFERVDAAFFKSAYGDRFKNKEACTEEEILCEKFFVLMENYYIEVLGEKMKHPAILFYYKHLANEKCMKVLEETYGFTRKDFLEVSAAKGIGGEIIKNEKDTKLIHDLWRQNAELTKRVEDLQRERDVFDTEYRKATAYIQKVQAFLPVKAYRYLKRILGGKR